jgi:adenylate cyclase
VRKGLRIPIAIKLILMTAAMIVVTVGAVAWRNGEKVTETFSRSQDDMNAELAASKAVEVDGVITKYLEKVRLVTDLMVRDIGTEEARKKALDLALGLDRDLVNLEIYELENGKLKLFRRETNERYLKSNGLDRSFIDRLRREVTFPLAGIFADKERIHIQNSTLPGKREVPLLSLGVPFADDFGVVRYVALADIRLEQLQKSFASKGARTLFLVDSVGLVLAHSVDRVAIEGRNERGSPIVAEAFAQITTRGQKASFLDPERGEKMVGAYAKTDFGPVVIVETPVAIALGAAKQLVSETAFVTLKVFWLVLFVVFLLSYSLTGSIEKLQEMVLEVAQGNFNVRANVQTADEVADLAQGFNKMVDGLKERDKVKNILNKFHGSTVTDDLMKSDLNLGGSKKDVTVFFSDIRDFTKFSEGHTPEEVVEMLNEYFQIMVSIIVKNGGIVDKFVGDAIMAVWGAPKSSGNDNLNAVKASLEMRVALSALNERRVNRGHSPVKIGMGLHAGPAISGTIGSTERMEYTVIGDTVNSASRIESSTKAFGADLLISDTVAKSVEGQFILELAGSAEVKGKAEPLKMYKVRGEIRADGTLQPIQTPYSDYEAGHADKVKIA